MVWLFWFSLVFVVYTFFGYPLFLVLIARFRERPHVRATIWPRVSVIIVAHNEAGQIDHKVRNTLDLEYPKEKREIIVVSDGSDDATADQARSYTGHGVQVIETQERRGKHFGQMVARDASSGDILVFTDTSVCLEAGTLQKMVSNFADPTVGCVSSVDRLFVKGTTLSGEHAYVGYDMSLRRLESRVNSLTNVSGSFFAARREVCEVWHVGQSSDFFLPLHAAAKGLRAVVDPECVGAYSAVRLEREELPRKVRTIVHGLDVFFSHLGLLNPLRYGLFSWQLLSHKLFRWLVPFAALGLLISNLFLWEKGIFYQVCLVGQVTLYGFGLLGRLSSRLAGLRPFKMAAFFLTGNLATLIAWLKYCSGERFVTWNPSRRV
jgi:hypothetical protein